MSLLKEAFKGMSWFGFGVTVLATVEALVFPENQTHFLTVAGLGLLATTITTSIASEVK